MSHRQIFHRSWLSLDAKLFHVEQKELTVLTSCPICGDTERKHVLTCRDHLVSDHDFDIQECASCGFWFTDPRPKDENLGEYYKSDEYVSHSESSKGLINWLYLRARSIAIKRKYRLVKNLTKGSRLLDYGCGAGYFAGYCGSKEMDVTGVEPDKDARAIARSKYDVETIDPAERDQLAESSFDAITLWHVLEHLPGLKEQMEWLKSRLSANGVLFIAVPNRSSFDARKYDKEWAAYDVPRHIYHFTPKDIETLGKSVGLKLAGMKPMKLDAYYVSMLSEKNKGGSTLLGFWNGFRSNLKAKNGTYSSQIYILTHA